MIQTSQDPKKQKKKKSQQLLVNSPLDPYMRLFHILYFISLPLTLPQYSVLRAFGFLSATILFIIKKKTPPKKKERETQHWDD